MGGETPSALATASVMHGDPAESLSVSVPSKQRRLKGRRNRRASAPNALAFEHFLPQISIDDFQLIRLLGEGGAGVVWYAIKKDTSQEFAVKIVDKYKIMGTSSADRLLAEREIMAMVEHPYILNMHFAFQDDTRIFFVIDYMPGGDFYAMLNSLPQKRINEDAARIYAGQLVMALEYLHKFDIVFRDLKPENILLTAEGKIKVADFGLAVKNGKKCESRKTVCGTPEYMAPEIIREDGHSKAVDLWSLGIIVFEMMVGETPWAGQSAADMFFSVLTQQPPFPSHMSEEAKSFITGLLEKDPNKRLGHDGVQKLREHEFFLCKKWTWQQLEAGQVEAPYVPPSQQEKSGKVMRSGAALWKVAMQKFHSDFKPFALQSSALSPPKMKGSPINMIRELKTTPVHSSPTDGVESVKSELAKHEAVNHLARSFSPIEGSMILVQSFKQPQAPEWSLHYLCPFATNMFGCAPGTGFASILADQTSVKAATEAAKRVFVSRIEKHCCVVDVVRSTEQDLSNGEVSSPVKATMDFAWLGNSHIACRVRLCHGSTGLAA